MAEKQINILMSLKDDFTKPLKKITFESKAQQNEFNKGKRTINQWADNANKKFLSVGKSILKATALLGTLGGAISVAGIKSFASESIELAQAQIDAETKLQAVLANIPSVASGGEKAIRAAKEELGNYASELQNVGVIGDEVTLSGMQQLATFQLSTESIKTLSKGMTDLLAQQNGLNSTQQDAVGVANMIGKAMSGQASALSRVGIIMDEHQKKVIETGTEYERAAMLAEVLQQNVGGVNEALANTDQGKIQQVTNAFGDFQEEVGKKLIVVKGHLAGIFADYLPTIQDKVLSATDVIVAKIDAFATWLDNHKQQISKGLETVGKIASKVFNAITKAIGFVIDHSNILIPVLAGVVAGFTAFNIISTISSLLTVVTTVMGAASTAGGILNLVLAANPLILVAAGIGLVIAAGVLLVKNWDKVKAAAQKLWEKVKSVFESVKNKISSVFDSIKQKVQPIIDWMTDKIQKIADLINTVKEGFAGLGSESGYSTDIDSRHKALGTPYFAGGFTHVNERGGEIIKLPGGSQIIPHDVSEKMVGGTNVTVNLTVTGNLIGNRQYMEETGQYVANKILMAMGTV